MNNNFSISEVLPNGNRIELYMSVYHTKYVVTAFSPDYKVLKSRKTANYDYALNVFTIYKNMFGK